MTRAGVYIYRTRKPGSLVGLAHLTMAERFAASGLAAVALDLTGSPWWLCIVAFVFSSGRHFAYVGETVNFDRRHREHVLGGGPYNKTRKPWSDLEPMCYRLRLPRWKWLLRSVETFLICLTLPVYNDKKNRWNPRRRTWGQAIRQRKARDRRSLKVSLSPSPAHILTIIILIPFIWEAISA